jgi:hypothetical protein
MDTDGVPFIIDNSANGAICNTRSLFLGTFEQKNVTKVTAHGKTSEIMRVGTIRLKLRDDNGDEWTYDIPNVVFDPDSPYSLLGIPFLGEYFAKDNPNESRDEETWILSRSSRSHFTWDHGQHERHFVHGENSLPELICNEGHSYFSAFCTRIRNHVKDNISYAFSSAFTMSPDGMKAHIIPMDSDNELIEEQWYKPPHMREPEPTKKRI